MQIITLRRDMHPGKAITIVGTFKNESDVVIAVTGVTLKIKLPSGVTSVFTGGALTTVGTGVYSYIFTPTTPGRHYVRYESSSPALSEESEFNVKETKV